MAAQNNGNKSFRDIQSDSPNRCQVQFHENESIPKQSYGRALRSSVPKRSGGKQEKDATCHRSGTGCLHKRKRAQGVKDKTDTSGAEKGLDPAFKTAALDHIKVFMFGGHDTTSSTICYVAYALSRHPEALKKVRQEYDEVFGPEVWQTAARIKEDPYIINKLPYTVAIVKECLRLWPPASSVRVGGPGQFVHYDGKQYPIEGDWIRRLSVYKSLLIASQVF